MKKLYFFLGFLCKNKGNKGNHDIKLLIYLSAGCYNNKANKWYPIANFCRQAGMKNCISVCYHFLFSTLFLKFCIVYSGEFDICLESYIEFPGLFH